MMLRAAATADDLAIARETIAARGYARGRDLAGALDVLEHG
ncbi:MAG TPA: hypothetical protein VGO80_20875 [Solirubrobacteraceae bacterium]|jgi:hypothetical protein|nr:hypothetical protein [Solirubrobacteraceae bacterium]